MPNIQKKPFMHSTKTCYACGKLIAFGSTDWTFNTRHAGLFAHQTCVGQPKSVPIPKPLPVPVQEFEEVVESNTVETIIDSAPFTEPEVSEPIVADITDKIVCDASKHSSAEIIKFRLRRRKYPFLFGAPGAGKTHLLESFAHDMETRFCLISCSSDMFKSEVIGARSPITGDYFTTEFRECWEHGGLILFDEVGLAPGAFLNILNSALAQKLMLFPDRKSVKMHKDSMIAFADNSALYGNDALFPERQDAGTAFRDRLTAIKFEYDLKLELRILTSIFKSERRAQTFHAFVLKLRTELERINVPVFASPRFAYAAAQDFVDRLDYNLIMEQNLIKGINGDISAQIKPILSNLRGSF